MATRVAQARDVALNEMNFRGISINTAETAITILSSDSGIIFIQHNASTTTYTLPAVADCAGKMFLFHNANGATATVVYSVAADIIGKHTSGAVTQTLTSAAIGDSLTLVGDGTNFYAVEGANDWTHTN